MAKKRTDDRTAIINELFRLSPEKKFSLKSLASASGGNDRQGRAAIKEIVNSMLAQRYITEVAPGKYKLSRKRKLFDENGNPIPSLPYSIIKSNDGKLYALYRGKNASLNPKKAMPAHDAAQQSQSRRGGGR